VVHVGLPYISDVETLDIDSGSGPSIKETKILVNKLTLLLERSRGLFIGAQIPTGDDPVEKMDPLKVRDGTDALWADRAPHRAVRPTDPERVGLVGSRGAPGDRSGADDRPRHHPARRHAGRSDEVPNAHRRARCHWTRR
jgi:hypothetical protein